MTVSLEVPIEMLDKGVSSQTTDQVFQQAETRICKYTFSNDDEFDGGDAADVDWEIVAQNVNATNGYDVELLNESVTIISTITVPANTGITRYKNTGISAFGTGVRLRLKGTGSNNDVRVYCSRILVGQTNATKTMVSIPLIQSAGDGFSNSTTVPVDSTTSTSYVQSDTDKYSIWLRNDADFDAFQADDTPVGGDRPFAFEVLLHRSSGIGSDAVYASLFNKTDNAQVTASEVSTTSTSVVALNVEVSSSATNFHDGDEHEVRIKASGTDGAVCGMLQARLRIRLANLTEAEVYYRFAKRRGNGLFGDTTADEQRILYDASKFDVPTVYHESTGRDPIGSNATVEVCDDGTNDTGVTSTTVVSGGSIDYSSSTRQRIRTSAITPDSGDRFIFRAQQPGNFNTALSISSWLVVHCETAAAPPSVFVPLVIQY